MNLRRTLDYTRMFDVMYHPDVEPHVSLGQKIPDLQPIIEDPLNVCLMNEHGGFLFVKHPNQNVYDVHTAFIPEGRGPHLVELAKQAREFMFFQANAEMLQTFVAHNNKPARHLAVAAGFVNHVEAELFGVPGWIMILERKTVCQ